MKKFTNILESQDNSDFLDDVKSALLEMLDKDLKILKFYIRDFVDTNNIYLYNLEISFINSISNKTYESYKKLFDLFHKNELDFFYSNSKLTSSGLLSDLADILNDLQIEIQSKKYNL